MPQAAEFIQKLRAAGVTATTLSWDGAYPPEYLAEVGQAGVGTIMACTCVLPAEDFVAEYTAAFGPDPGLYAMEGFELATIMLTGIASGAATDRPTMVQHFRDYDGWGVGRRYQWTGTGELTTPATFLYEVVPTAG